MVTLAPENIRTYWPVIRPGLEYIQSECSTEWMPEDIFAACIAGAAELWVDPAHNDGFLILQERPLSFEHGKSLLVWVAYLNSGGGVPAYLPLIEEIARRRGCVKVEFWSPRIGMGRLTEKHGYAIENVIFSKRIT